MPIPEQANLDGVMIVLFVVGLVLLFGGMGLVQFEKISIARSKTVWIIGGLLLVVSFFFFALKADTTSFKNLTNTDTPFQVAEVYDFDKVKDFTYTKPWVSIPITKQHNLLIQNDKSFVNSGSQSLRLVANIQSFNTDQRTEYAGIGATNLDLSNVKAISAWIFVPESEPTNNSIFSSHLVIYVYNEKIGQPVGFIGETENLKAGAWTQVFIGTFSQVEATDIIWNGKVDEIYLTIWSDKPYSGSFYIDDISIYK